MDAILVLITCPELDVAKHLAYAAVNERLAACGNIIPGLTSVYRWEGKVCEDGECLLLLKASTTTCDQLEALMIELHPYDTPEFVVIKPDEINQKYADWLFAQL